MVSLNNTVYLEQPFNYSSQSLSTLSTGLENYLAYSSGLMGKNDYGLGNFISYTLSKVSNLAFNTYAQFVISLSYSFPVLEKTVVIEEIESCDTIIENSVKDFFSDKASNKEYAKPNFYQCSQFPSKTRKLESNLELANQLLKETTETIKYSSNNFAKNLAIIEQKAKEQFFDLTDLKALMMKTDNCIKRTRYVVNRISFNYFDLYKNSYLITRNTKIGNCQEMSRFLFFRSMQKGIWDVPVELVSIKNGDHVFVVIDREPHSDINDYKTWGPNAVVADAWANIAFEASEMENKLKDYEGGVSTITGEPFVLAYDPKIHILRVIRRNTDWCSS